MIYYVSIFYKLSVITLALYDEMNVSTMVNEIPSQGKGLLHG